MIYIGPRFRELLKQRRLELGLSQGAVAASLGVAGSSICRWERGTRTPDSQTVERLARVLKLRPQDILQSLPPGPHPEGNQLLKPFLREVHLYEPNRQRETYQKILDSLEVYPAEMQLCLQQLKQRNDQPWLRHFLREVLCTSTLEALGTTLLLQGAFPVECMPDQLDNLRFPVVHEKTGRPAGGELRPALISKSGCLYMFQVSQLTFEGIFTTDILVGSRQQGVTVWRGVELDGKGHDPRRDLVKTKALKIEVYRFSEDDVRRPGFFEVVESRVTSPNAA